MELSAFVAAAAVMLAAIVASDAKTTIEPCSGSDSCPALLGYTLYADMKVSEVAALFATDPSALLAANALDFAAPGAAHRILPAGLLLRVPARCACADGVRKSVAVRYAARPADTLATLADVVFAGLASADQIRGANGLADADPDAPLDAGQPLVVPLPCVCFNSSDSNLPAVYLSYVVQVGDTVPAIAAGYETTVTDVMNVNAMGSPVAAPGDILAIPLPGMATQPTKGKGAWEGNEKEESAWEEAVRTVRKKEKEELERKKKEEEDNKMAERARMQKQYDEYILFHKRRNAKLKAERDREARIKFLRSCQLEQIARERANRMHLEEVAREAERIKEERAQAEAAKTEERHHFFDSVIQLARDLREKEELAEEAKKKKARGEGAFATQ